MRPTPVPLRAPSLGYKPLALLASLTSIGLCSSLAACDAPRFATADAATRSPTGTPLDAALPLDLPMNKAERDLAMDKVQPDLAMNKAEPDLALNKAEPDLAMNKAEPDLAMNKAEPDLAMNTVPLDMAMRAIAPDLAFHADLASAPDLAPSGCRSSLYPANWAPGFADSQGRFLHDFSYAGYHHGDAPLPDSANARVFDAVALHGADPTGATNSCPAIQATLDDAAAAGGGVVHLPTGVYRCQAPGTTASELQQGQLWLRGSHVVLRGDGPSSTYLYFAHTVPMDDYPDILVSPDNPLQSQWSFGREIAVPLAADAASGSTTVDVASLCGGGVCLQAGDDVAIEQTVTDGFMRDHLAIDSSGNVVDWAPIYQQTVPVFYRTIVSVETLSSGYRLHLDVPLRATLRTRDAATLYKEFGYLSESGIEHLSVSNTVPWSAAWANNMRELIEFAHDKDCWARDVHTFASPWSAIDTPASGYHVQSVGLEVAACKSITVDSCDFEKAENRGGGGNGYLYWLSLSNEVLVRDSRAINGRHNYTIGGLGLAGSGNVFLRDLSQGAMGQNGPTASLYPSFSDFHNYLATANLVDGCTLRDGWLGAHNPGDFGQAATECVFWNDAGGGMIASYQFDWGYVVGVNDMQVHTALDDPVTNDIGFLQGDQIDFTAPADFVECAGALPVSPASLYEDQLARRHSH